MKWRVHLYQSAWEGRFQLGLVVRGSPGQFSVEGADTGAPLERCVSLARVEEALLGSRSPCRAGLKRDQESSMFRAVS